MNGSFITVDKNPLSLVYNGSSLERLRVAKLLGVHLDNHLIWNEHITKTFSSCYSTLAVLRKVRYIAPFPIRKQLVECLIFTKLHYCSVVVSPLRIPDYQLKRLQRVQNACAAFVLGKYCSAKEVLNLGWLPIYERREHNVLKLTHKGIYSNVLPDSLKFELHKVSTYNLRSSCAPSLLIFKQSSTFQDMAARSLNALSADIRNITVLAAGKFATAVQKYCWRLNTKCN